MYRDRHRMIWLLFALLSNAARAETPPSTASDADQLDTTPPKVLDIDDPFSRDLKRAAEDAAGGIEFDGQELRFDTGEIRGRSLLGRESQAAVTAARFRVVGLAVTRPDDRAEVLVDAGRDTPPGMQPFRPYLRVGSHVAIAEAHQQAIDLMASYAEYMDMSFIIRPHETGQGADLDLGPFRHIDHAEGYCDLLLDITSGLVSDCYAVLEHPEHENQQSFSSSAIIRLSSETVANVLEDAAVFDLAAAADQMISIREGDFIGSEAALAVKITPSGIMLADQAGNIAKLPTAFIPEIAFHEGDDPVHDLIAPLSGIGTGDAPGSERPASTAADFLLEQHQTAK